MVRGPSAGKRYRISRKNLMIGRDALADIRIGDPEVSRQHALIVPAASGILIQDLGSTNGTFVADKRIGSELYFVEPGQTILLGTAVALELLEAEMPEPELESEGSGAIAEKKAPQESAPEPQVSQPDVRSDLRSMPAPKRDPRSPERAKSQLTSPEAQAQSSAWEVPGATEMSPNLILGTALLLLCCALSALLFLLLLGGDWLLRLAGIVP